MATNRSFDSIELHDSCVMCNTAPALLCEWCKSCRYVTTVRSSAREPIGLVTRFFAAAMNHLYLLDRLQKADLPFFSRSIRSSLGLLGYLPPAKFLSRVMSTNVPSWSLSLAQASLAESSFSEIRDVIGIHLLEDHPVSTRGYSIVLTFRDAFLKDGSALNRSILESVKKTGTIHHKWWWTIGGDAREM